jgi:glyoxylase-like metal-dependent hydrolase (beta-lactamase superfamily II)
LSRLITNLKRKDLGTPDLPIIGGADCDGVTATPKHGETLKVGGISVKSLHTPCHTQDSICWFMQDGDEKAVFTGDTLFISGMCCRTSYMERMSRLRSGIFRDESADFTERDTRHQPCAKS